MIIDRRFKTGFLVTLVLVWPAMAAIGWLL